MGGSPHAENANGPTHSGMCQVQFNFNASPDAPCVSLMACCVYKRFLLLMLHIILPYKKYLNVYLDKK